jgi:KDO2-lipid IV(A) lauroyltransferase
LAKKDTPEAPKGTSDSPVLVNSPSFPQRYYPLWLLLKGLSHLPFRVLYGLSSGLYLLSFYVIGYRKKVVYANLRNSFPERTPAQIEALAKGFYRHLSDLVVEVLKLNTISREELLRRVRFRNPELVQEQVEQGRPVILMGGHLANWEWLTAAVSAFFPYAAEGIYKPLSNEFFESYLLRMRSRFGALMVKTKETLREFIRRKQVPRLIGMLSDQTPPGGEVQYWADFLNQDTPFFVGVDKLAPSFHYAVIFLGFRRVRRGYYECTFEPLYDGVEALDQSSYPLTETFARHLEAWIKAYPADYLWSHRRWKNKRPKADE